MADIVVPQTRTVQIRVQGIRVLVIAEGQAIMDLPWEAALEIAKALNGAARKAEEQAKAPQIIADQALLMRAGAPFGLSNDSAIQKEAGKEAAWNRDLRRYMPGGIKSQSIVGVPTIKQEPPKKAN